MPEYPECTKLRMAELPPVTEDEWWDLVGLEVKTRISNRWEPRTVIQPFTVNGRPMRLYGRVFAVGELVIQLSSGGSERYRSIYRRPRELRLVS